MLNDIAKEDSKWYTEFLAKMKLIKKQTSEWYTKPLAVLFYNRKFIRSLGNDKENYLFNLTRRDFCSSVTLPKEMIPDDVTLSALIFTHKKDPSTLPILLKYFTHKNLLKEAKDDLDKINQKLQGIINEELKKLQDEQKLLQEEVAELLNKEVDTKQAKVLATNSKKITETSSKIEEIELYKKNIKNLLSGKKVDELYKKNIKNLLSERKKEMGSYSLQYLSILSDELTKVMEEKLKAYMEDNKADIEKSYQSINSKARRVVISEGVTMGAGVISGCCALNVPLIYFYDISLSSARFSWGIHCFAVILFSIAATSLVIAGIVYLVNKHYKQSFVKEMENFIEEPRHMDKATSTENVEESKQQEQEVRDLIDFSDSSYASQVVTPSAPPLEEEVKGLLYPNLEKCFPQYSAAKEVESRSQGW